MPSYRSIVGVMHSVINHRTRRNQGNLRKGDIEPAEHRRCERRDVETTVGLFLKPDSKGCYQRAVTINLCEHGAKVLGDIELSPGQSIDLVLKAAPTERVPAKVVWERRMDGHSEAGLRFMMEPAKVAALLLSGGLA